MAVLIKSIKVTFDEDQCLKDIKKTISSLSDTRGVKLECISLEIETGHFFRAIFKNSKTNEYLYSLDLNRYLTAKVE